MSTLDNPKPPAPSPTARNSIDTMGLGFTPGQRGAEILAGLRAKLMPSPDTQALSRFTGRVTAQMVMTMERNPAALNYVAVRPGVMTELARRAIAVRRGVIANQSTSAEGNTDAAQPEPRITIVDIATGFSPRGLQLARTMSNIQIIEVDLPGVIQEKISRLRQANIQLPGNLSWRKADLGITPLKDVLEGETVDVVIAEGLTAYFDRDHNVRIAANIRNTLNEGGAYICDFAWSEGMNNAEAATSMFSRQAGKYVGIIDSEETIRKIMLEAGYREAVVYRPEAMAKELGLPLPVFEFGLISSAMK